MDEASVKDYDFSLVIFILIGGIMFHVILGVLLFWQTSSYIFADEVYPDVYMIDTVDGLKATGYKGILKKDDMPYKTIIVDQKELPEKFDYRDYQGILSPVRDQKSCGSCWSFAITAALESSTAKQLGKPVQDLSEQHMVSCDDQSYGCSGGFMDSADFVVRNGLTDEKSFPYTAKNTRCKPKLPVVEKATKYYLIGTPKKGPTTEQIKTALIEYGPVFVTVDAGGSGWTGATGEVTTCKKRGTTNHMVVVVGYDKTGWIIRNSWGTAWADKGYSHIKYGCDLIAEEAGFVVADDKEYTYN
jgi:C1A family cysteine protease